MSITDIVASMALGAFAYHMYAKIHNLEAAIGEGHVIQLGGALDIAGQDDDNEAKQKFGFSTPRR